MRSVPCLLRVHPWLLLPLLGLALPVVAQYPALEKRLAQALQLYPTADEDQNGILSLEEAQRYLDAHPELKAMLRGKTEAATQPATYGPGETGPRVFVCAHSYMIFTASMLPPLGVLSGLGHRHAGQQMLGGSRVIQHWNLPDEKNVAKAALRAGNVDVLLLSPHRDLPDPGIESFVRLGLEKNPDLRVLVQASWPPFDGRNEQGATFKNAQRDAVTVEELHRQRDQHRVWLRALEAQVKALNTALGRETLHIVPVSEAVYALRERIATGPVPGLAKQSEMFRDDHGHPAASMALLATYCHFAAIHGRTPIGLPVPESLGKVPDAEPLNRLLQELAWQAVSSYPMSGVKAETAEVGGQ